MKSISRLKDKKVQVALLACALFALSGCTGTSSPNTDFNENSPQSKDLSDFAREAGANEFPEIITRCDHGNRLYFGGAYQAISVAAADPTCPQPVINDTEKTATPVK